MIMLSGAPEDRSLLGRFGDVALDNLNAARERFGTYSLEFVMAATYVLDFIAAIKDRASEWEDQDEFEALCLFDFKEIRDAFTILSGNTRDIFEEYYKSFVTPSK